MNFISQLRTAYSLLAPGRPFILYHKPTARCDCRCRFCDFWVHQPAEESIVDSDKIMGLLDEARRAGITTYTVWGGEPLLVPDLPRWLSRARGHGMQTVVCTSGSRLLERAAELGPFTERLLLSVEAVGERHDRLRGSPGLFERLVSGLAAYREHAAGQVILWSNLSRENRDQVEELARFARDQNAAIEFFPAAHYPGYNDLLVLDRSEREEAFGRALELKRRGWPVHNTTYALELMRSGRPFKCNIARLSVQLSSEGKFFACEARLLPELEPYGELGGIGLKDLIRSEAYQRTSRELSSCNLCLLPCVAHLADGLPAQGARMVVNELAFHKDRRREPRG